MYERPHNVEEIKSLFPDKALMLLRDRAHLWRAETGIELIHLEPTIKEQRRIWLNWREMSDIMKRSSDKKSIELFGKDNEAHNKEIMQTWIESEKDFY